MTAGIPSLSVKRSWFSSPQNFTAQLVKSPPAVQETPVQCLGWKDPREKR